MNRWKQVSAAALICMGIVGASGCGQAEPSAAGTISFPSTIQVQNAEKNVIVVQSSETVKVVPDMAEIRFGILTQEDNAKACQEKNNQDLTAVIQFLKDFGIGEESIQTSNYGMQPIYDWNSGRTRTITGYEMETNLTVSDITIEQAGTLLTACVDAGINNIDRISYLSSQYDACYQEALAKAIETARQKAQAIAQASGCTLGAVSYVEEYSGSQAARYNSSPAASEAMAVRDTVMEDMAVEPGQLSIEARISVEFSID